MTHSALLRRETLDNPAIHLWPLETEEIKIIGVHSFTLRASCWDSNADYKESDVECCLSITESNCLYGLESYVSLNCYCFLIWVWYFYARVPTLIAMLSASTVKENRVLLNSMGSNLLYLLFISAFLLSVVDMTKAFQHLLSCWEHVGKWSWWGCVAAGGAQIRRFIAVWTTE